MHRTPTSEDGVMLLGISSYTYTWAVGVPGHAPARPMGAIGLVERAAELGASVVQYADNLPLAELAEPEIEALAERAEEAGVGIEVGTRGIGAGNLRDYLRVAERLGSPIVRAIIEAPDDSPGHQATISRLREVRPAFERAGVALAVENHDFFRAEDLRRIVEAAGGEWIGVCLDTVNNFGALEGPEHVIDTLGPLTINLHIKDFRIARHPHMMGFEITGTPAGEGQLDIPVLLARLSAMGRDPNAILELWTPPEDSLEATIAKEARWAEQSVAFLRELVGQDGQDRNG